MPPDEWFPLVGIPATRYGTRAENIHGVDERVSLDSMRRVTKVMTSLIIDWGGDRKKSG